MTDLLRAPLFCLFLLGVLLLGTTAGCSLVLDLQTCTDDSDCEAGSICSSDSLCQASGQSTYCETTSDCPDSMVCNDLGSCQQPSSLLSAPCTQAAGDLDADGVFIIGVLLPLSGAEEGFGRPLFNAIQLALIDFMGIGGVNGHPLALLICDTQGLDELALAGAEHLAEVGVTAIIGPDYSSQTIAVANQVTMENEIVLVSPSATAATISSLDMVWRTTASDAVQGKALGELVAYILNGQPQRAEPVDIGHEPKLAVLVRNQDTYADGLRQSLVASMPSSIVTDSSRFTTYNYPNAAAGEGQDYTDVVIDLLNEDDPPPEVVVILGSSEAWIIAELLDGQWDHDPIFVFADAARNRTEAAAVTPALRGRVWGTAPQHVDTSYAPYLSFSLKYHGVYRERPDDYQFVANAFDAFYVIALGAAYGGITGPGIHQGMAQLSSGETIEPNQPDAQRAIASLSAGDSVNYRGASGPINFDENGDPQAGPTILWCFDDDGLPAMGVIVDEELTFHPHHCGENVEEPSNQSNSTDPECTGDVDCIEEGFFCDLAINECVEDD